MDIIFQGLVQYVLKMRAFGTVTVNVFAFVLMSFDGLRKPFLGPVNIPGDLREIGEFKGSAVLLHQGHQGNFVKLQIVLVQCEFLLGKIIGLIDQINVFDVH